VNSDDSSASGELSQDFSLSTGAIVDLIIFGAILILWGIAGVIFILSNYCIICST
jgi:hypothetical protein